MDRLCRYIHLFSGQFRRQCTQFGNSAGNFGGSAVRRPVGHDSAAGMSKLVALFPLFTTFAFYRITCRLSKIGREKVYTLALNMPQSSGGVHRVPSVFSGRRPGMWRVLPGPGGRLFVIRAVSKLSWNGPIRPLLPVCPPVPHCPPPAVHCPPSAARRPPPAVRPDTRPPPALGL